MAAQGEDMYIGMEEDGSDNMQAYDSRAEDAEVGVERRFEDERLVYTSPNAEKLRAVIGRELMADGVGSARALEEGDDLLPFDYSEDDLGVLPRYMLQDSLLQRCISTDGLWSREELLVLMREYNRPTGGEKTPVAPSWYKKPKANFGERRIGLHCCSNAFGVNACRKAECEESGPFKACGGCRLQWYCSVDCQKADWKKRHRKFCKAAAKEREQSVEVARLMQMFNRSHGHDNIKLKGDKR
jgi:MYND finger